jgi:hypothetical protein
MTDFQRELVIALGSLGAFLIFFALILNWPWRPRH